jgi:hypothetical protein
MAVARVNTSAYFQSFQSSAPICSKQTDDRSRGRLNYPRTLRGRLLDVVVPMLILLATAAAMWFVVTDGWFQLVGFWAR